MATSATPQRFAMRSVATHADTICAVAAAFTLLLPCSAILLRHAAFTVAHAIALPYAVGAAMLLMPPTPCLRYAKMIFTIRHAVCASLLLRCHAATPLLLYIHASDAARELLFTIDASEYAATRVTYAMRRAMMPLFFRHCRHIFTPRCRHAMMSPRAIQARFCCHAVLRC